MKFQTKLYLGFGIILFMTLVFSIVLTIEMTEMNHNMNEIVNVNYEKVQLTNQLRNNFDIADRGIYEIYVWEENSDLQLQQMIDSIEESKISTQMIIQRLDELVILPEAVQLLDQIRKLKNTYYHAVNELIADLNDEDMIVHHFPNIDLIRTQLIVDIHNFNRFQENLMNQTLVDTRKRYEATIQLTIGMIALLILILVGVAYWSITSVRNSLKRMVEVMDQVKESDPENLPRLPILANDETGSIAEAFNRMATSLEHQTTKEKRVKEQLKENYWVKSQVAEITTGYHAIDDMRELAKWFITKVSPLIGAQYGVFYLNQDHLVKMASYADSGEDIGETHIQLGEGLVGQCALENRQIMIDRPPDDYIRIKSSLGQATPQQIVIMPIVHKGVNEAVIEFASLRTFTSLEISLLHELTSSLGLTIAKITAQMQVQRLLKEAQVYTEELQTQSEELQQQQEELSTLNEQLGEQFKQVEQRNNELIVLKDELETKNEQLLRASEYKSQFLANISHELRTPLNSLLILSQILAENKEGNLLDKQIEYVQTIHSSGNELLKLINEILDLSKIESGKMEVVYEAVDFKNLLQSITQHFYLLAMEKEIEFRVTIDPELEQLHIHSDTQKLQQIMRNLLSNAIKFTERGHVHFELKSVQRDQFHEFAEIQGNEHEQWICFQVEDTGIGISDDKLDLIFESFQQADGTTSRQYGGTGLGLAIVQQLVKLLGGYIFVKSEEGKGSTFTVLLPINQEDHVLVKHDHDHAFEAGQLKPFEVNQETFDSNITMDQTQYSQLQGKKILLVDDDMRNIYALTLALKNVGLTVHFAENGLEGLEMLKQHTDTDLVLMDIMMPKMDGYQTIRLIRENPKLTNIPIIALTAKAMKADKQKCIQAGANDYISKPIHIDQLLSLIHVWLYRQE